MSWQDGVITAVMLAGLSVATQPASATCAMNAYPMTVEMRGMRPMIKGRINGHDLDFLLDSGSFFNGVSAKFALEHKLTPIKVGAIGTRLPVAAETEITGAGGTDKVSSVVKAEEFQIGNLKFKGPVFLTLGLLDVGLLGQNFLKNFDIDYDLAKQEIKLIAPKGCEKTSLAYWTKDAYSLLPLQYTGDKGDHAIATIVINGAKMRAVFDTGAGNSFITRTAAARAGVRVDAAGVENADPVRGVDRINIKA